MQAIRTEAAIFVLSGTANLALAALASARARRAAGSLPLALLFVALFLWQVAEGIARIVPLRGWELLVMACSPLPPAFLWHFTVSYCGRGASLRSSVVFVYLCAAGLGAASALSGVSERFASFTASVRWNLVYFVLLLPPVVASWALVERRRRREPRKPERKSLALVSAGIAVGVAIVVAEDGSLFGGRIPFVGPVGSVLAACLLAGALLGPQLLEARIPAPRLLALASAAAGAVGLELWLVSRFTDGTGPVGVALPVLMVVALALYRLLLVDWLEAAGQRERLAQLGMLAASVAHEIRNPLTSIKGAAQIVERELSDRPGLDSAREYLTLLAGEVDRLDGVMEALLAFARPRPPRLRSVAVNALSGELARAARIGLPPGIALAEDYAPEEPELEADPELLKQAVLNLIKNAAEAVAETGTITLRTRVVVGRRPSVVIEVLDDGPGIPAEQLDRIASPFFTTKARGTGLGLAIAAGIAEAHGGALKLENTDPHGARASLMLPRRRAAEGGAHG